METFLVYGNLNKNPLYSCNNTKLTFWELSARHEKQRLLGALYICYGITVQICYLLSLSVIARKEFRSMSCYKLMLTLGILDVICVTVSSELTGYFYYIGFEYCMLPTITYICGCWMNCG
ncbi:unnamed protein product, partial [Mesorhabditis belari]|uniref:Uncharacterized protein n=1 Tax=Mesorhabditis belari TaxID=2138241 RepID=A0AAF3EQ57_9BILA